MSDKENKKDDDQERPSLPVDELPERRPFIRHVSRPSHPRSPRPPKTKKEKQYNRIKRLKCFDEIDRRLRLGKPPSVIAAMIQEEFKEETHLARSTLAKMVYEYKRSIPPMELALFGRDLEKSNQLDKKIEKRLDELAEIEKLYDMQMKRIAIDIKNEETIKKLLPTTGHEIFVASKLLKQSADLKMDLGLTKRQMGTVEITGQIAAGLTERFGVDGDTVGKVFTDVTSRKKVLGLAERLAQIVGKTGIDASKIIDAKSAEVKEAKEVKLASQETQAVSAEGGSEAAVLADGQEGKDK